jgi:hypothetical protein
MEESSVHQEPFAPKTIINQRGKKRATNSREVNNLKKEKKDHLFSQTQRK